MRAARLLQMLLLLQNRGRLTSRQLSEELEVSMRTILRDVDAMTEAGLPIIVYQGNQGGIELGFNYRTRLTGLSADEAEALGIILNRSIDDLRHIDRFDAGRTAIAKVTESMPDKVRVRMKQGADAFHMPIHRIMENDHRIVPMAAAIRGRQKVKIRAVDANARLIHPIRLAFDVNDVAVTDALAPDCAIALQDWGDINISSKQF